MTPRIQLIIYTSQHMHYRACLCTPFCGSRKRRDDCLVQRFCRRKSNQSLFNFLTREKIHIRSTQRPRDFRFYERGTWVSSSTTLHKQSLKFFFSFLHVQHSTSHRKGLITVSNHHLTKMPLYSKWFSVITQQSTSLSPLCLTSLILLAISNSSAFFYNIVDIENCYTVIIIF